MDQHRGRARGMRPDERVDLRRPQMIPDMMQNLSLGSMSIPINASNLAQQQREILQNNLMRSQFVAMQAAGQQFPQMQQHHAMMQQNMPVYRTYMEPTQPRSTLSAMAPEFVPRGPSFPQNAAAMPLNMMMPDGSQGNPQVQPVHTIPQWEYLEHPCLTQVDQHVVSLTLKPYKYDEISIQICTILSKQVREPNLMKEIVSLIIEQGIGEANFRYSGAKLCQHLSEKIVYSYTGGPSFRELLLRWCQDEFQCKDLYYMNNLTRLQGFCLFLADLHTQLKTPSAQPLEPINEAICKLLETLMIDATNENNLKCVVKVLKVAGCVLDGSESASMEKVMIRLKDLAMVAPVSSEMKKGLLNTIELRASNWGRNGGSSVQNIHPEAPLGTVYYCPDGKIKKVVLDDAGDSDPEDSNYGYSPTNVAQLEGDEADAFEEFLQSQKK